MSYGKVGMSLIWIPAHTTVPPFATARSATGTRAPAGAKMIAAFSGSGGQGVRRPGPFGAERAGELLRRLIARACEGEDAPPLGSRHLRHEMRRRAEAVQPEPRRVPGGHERAVADEPRAQQRSGLDVAVGVGQGEAETLVGDGVFGVTTVQLVAREARAVAQVFAARATIATDAARPAQPGYPEALAGREALAAGADPCNRADDLVAGHEWQLGIG